MPRPDSPVTLYGPARGAVNLGSFPKGGGVGDHGASGGPTFRRSQRVGLLSFLLMYFR